MPRRRLLGNDDGWDYFRNVYVDFLTFHALTERSDQSEIKKLNPKAIEVKKIFEENQFFGDLPNWVHIAVALRMIPFKDLTAVSGKKLRYPY